MIGGVAVTAGVPGSPLEPEGLGPPSLGGVGSQVVAGGVSGCGSAANAAARPRLRATRIIGTSGSQLQ